MYCTPVGVLSTAGSTGCTSRTTIFTFLVAGCNEAEGSTLPSRVAFPHYGTLYCDLQSWAQ